MPEKEPVLQLDGLSKHFGGLIAVNQVSLTIYPGEVVGLLGDNGAGKSTLIKMISGVYRPDQGTISIASTPVHFSTPMDARKAGIETIYQDLALCENLDASSNLFLGREPLKRRLGLFKELDRKLMQSEAHTLLEQLDIQIPDLTRPIRELSGGQRQAIAIARTIYWNARLLIMDEPTAALGVPEQRKVLQLIRTLRERGTPILLISHNMQDVFEVADRVIVLRQGRKVGERLIQETNQNEIISLITGSEQKGLHA
ncbi:simple sugar transport system ATP-binding protein [Thermosporothrix hazakensis]|jgi:ABC-type sugar transport system ATPase subunit|uniref:Simple sugar transport system ATP-binding protein n=1 Tax=Thermosporothrix hazakensis TaxID=644383 RepID=A0A326US98_THEHA|nr:ATP-binding cassette domain-containing protein [Thermosporothrix hazakensis]PZW36749.1 simple sugar transport system ATP-binding protein [Thermosporothrix hazakensis]GCE47399.1 sugar ABC transporter ATP-binding protein [Thermosporothrix hazakensis]